MIAIVAPPPRGDESGGRPQGRSESFTTVDGIYNWLSWDFGTDSGWATIRITDDAAGNVRYEMVRFSSYVPSPRREQCALLRE